jgi:tripartite-type tricarboxylate transporter receptor subunit TctC
MRRPGTLISGVTALLVAAAALAAAPNAAAQAWPTKPIRLVVPYTAGGSSDFVGRLMAQKLTEGLGQPVTVDNKPGIVGTDTVAKSPPDGYTLALVGMTTRAANPSLYKALPYDPVKDFAPISVAIVSPLVLVVNPALPANSVQELIAYAKANPGNSARRCIALACGSRSSAAAAVSVPSPMRR